MIIYKTINLINGKFYIGKDSNNNPNYLGSGIILKNAIKKHGKENFEKITLQKCASRKELNEREIYWIKKLNATNKKIGYNLAPGGEGFSIYDLPIESQIKFRKAIKIIGKNKSKRAQLGVFSDVEKLSFKMASERKKLGLFTEAEKAYYEQSSKRKKLGLFTIKEKIAAKKNGKNRKKIHKKFGYSDAQKLGFKKCSLKQKGINNPHWNGYIYIFNQNKIINKFITLLEASKYLNIDFNTFKKILNKKCLILKDYNITIKNKLSNLDGCEFIQTKENLTNGRTNDKKNNIRKN
jgi:hypothetical protein